MAGIQDKKMAEKDILIKSLPLLPLKNSVLFPGLLMPLAVGRPASVAAVESAFGTEDKEIVVVSQREREIGKVLIGVPKRILPRVLLKRVVRHGVLEMLERHGAFKA